MSDKPQIGEFCWNELMTTDIKKAKDFYNSLFGWVSVDHDMGNRVYTMFKMGDKEIGGMLQPPTEQAQQIPPHWMSYVLVENLDATVKKAESLGAKIKVAAKQAGEFGRLAVIQDPTGAFFGAWEPAKSK